MAACGAMNNQTEEIERQTFKTEEIKGHFKTDVFSLSFSYDKRDLLWAVCPLRFSFLKTTYSSTNAGRRPSLQIASSLHVDVTILVLCRLPYRTGIAIRIYTSLHVQRQDASEY